MCKPAVARRILYFLFVFILCISPFSSAAGETRQYADARTGGWLDKIDVSVVSSADAVTQLDAGTIDLFNGSLPASGLQSIKDAGLNYAASTGLYYDLLFNPAVFSSGKLNPFHDRKIREAVNWLLDRNYLNTSIYSSANRPKWLPLTTDFPEYNDLAAFARGLEIKYAYNFSRAQNVIKTEMVSLGAHLNAGGKWVYGGSPVTLIFIIRNDGDGTRLPLGDYAANQLEAVGFTVDRQYKSAGAAAALWIGSDPADGLWSIYTAAWSSGSLVRDEKSIFQEMYLPNSVQGLPALIANEPDLDFQQVGDDLAFANFTDLSDRQKKMVEAMNLAMQDSLQVWLIEGYNYSPYAEDVQVAHDLGTGIGATQVYPYTLRFTGTEGGSLKWADADLFTDPWNPVAGSNWSWDQAVLRATSSGGLMADPYTGLAVPFRIAAANVTANDSLVVTDNFGWVNLSFSPVINVPANAWVDWDSATGTFITRATKYPGGLTALIKSEVTYPADLLTSYTWQDGSPLSVADFIMPMIMLFERGHPGYYLYDTNAEAVLNSFLSSFRGFRITSTAPLTLEYYTDAYSKDAELNVYPLWPNYGLGEAPWHAIALGNFAEQSQQFAYSFEKADTYGRQQLDLVDPTQGTTLNSMLSYLITNKVIPFAPTLAAYVNSTTAVNRYTNLQTWYGLHNHFWVGTGPYYIDSYDKDDKTLTLLRSATFPDPSDRWSFWDEPVLADVSLMGDDLLHVTTPSAYDAYVTYHDGGGAYSELQINHVNYVLLNASGDAVSSGSAALDSTGHYTFSLSKAQIRTLQTGAGKLVLGVSPKVVCIPAVAVKDLTMFTLQNMLPLAKK